MPDKLFKKLLSFLGDHSKKTAEGADAFQRSPETIRRWRWKATGPTSTSPPRCSVSDTCRARGRCSSWATTRAAC